MNETKIIKYVTESFSGVDVVTASSDSGAPEAAWGDTFFFYDPDRVLDAKARFPFATIVTKDYGDFDRASNLNRPGVFRLNMGLSKETYRSLFEEQSGGEAGGPAYDFSALDRIMPHPVYAAQRFVCVLNPSEATFHTAVRPLLADAYDLARKRYAKRGQVE